MSKKILIVEDDEAISRNLEVALNGDYEIFVANSGAQGLEIARDKIPDLILLDYMLQDTTGAEVMSELKSSEKTNEIPVVVLTNRSDPDTISAIIAAGGKEYWLKTDWSINDIVNRVAEMLAE